MSRRAKEGTCLPALARMAIPQCRAAEQECPRTGPGRPPDYKDWKIAVLILIAVFKKRKSKSAQYRYLREHRSQLMALLGMSSFPARSTYFDRYRRAHRLFTVAIRLQGEKAVAEGVAKVETVAVDKSLMTARGPQWGWKNRREDRIPKGLHGVDRECGWGICSHHGWVHGYCYEVVVAATKGSTVLPLLASVETANVREPAAFMHKIEFLHGETRNVLADAGYDSNACSDRIEYDETWRPTGRRFICPPNPRGNGSRVLKVPTRRKRALARKRRLKRISFYESKKGRRLFARRGQTVEPFNDWFKSLFELDARVWHRGLDNNRTQVLAAMFGYQLLLRYNLRHGRSNGQIKWILDSL